MVIKYPQILIELGSLTFSLMLPLLTQLTIKVLVSLPLHKGVGFHCNLCLLAMIFTPIPSCNCSRLFCA